MKGIKTTLCLLLCVIMTQSSIVTEFGENAKKVVLNNNYYIRNIPIKDVTFEHLLNLDLSKPCGYSAEQLRTALPAPMKDLAGTYIAQEKDGMNALFKAAMDALESHNTTKCFEPNNISGWFTDKQFQSKEECILYVGSKMRRWYLTEPTQERSSDIGKYYRGCTISDIVYYYSPKANGEFNSEYVYTVTSMVYKWTKEIETAKGKGYDN